MNHYPASATPAPNVVIHPGPAYDGRLPPLYWEDNQPRLYPVSAGKYELYDTNRKGHFLLCNIEQVIVAIVIVQPTGDPVGRMPATLQEDYLVDKGLEMVGYSIGTAVHVAKSLYYGTGIIANTLKRMYDKSHRLPPPRKKGKSKSDKNIQITNNYYF